MPTTSGTQGPHRPRIRLSRDRRWLSPNTPGSWWNADGTDDAASQSGPVVDQEMTDQQMGRKAPVGTPAHAKGRTGRQAPQPAQPVIPSNHQVVQHTEQDDTWLALIHDAVTDGVVPWIQGVGRWWRRLGHGAMQLALTVIMVVPLVLLLVLLVRITTAYLHSNSGAHNPAALPTVQRGLSPVKPTTTLVPTATPTQTELDGVITIENLDNQNPFAGDVSVTADNGHFYCRNAPEPHSTWHIVLAAGATTEVPCVIPLSSPPTLPAHTFTAVESGSNGQGRVLVDNLTLFTGTAYYPTTTPGP
jgi:hypothetical protein